MDRFVKNMYIYHNGDIRCKNCGSLMYAVWTGAKTIMFCECILGPNGDRKPSKRVWTEIPYDVELWQRVSSKYRKELKKLGD
jgi:hypothetical protein